MDEIVSKVETKLGPLAVWQWGLLAAGGVVLLRFMRRGQGNGTQTVTLQPNTQTGIPAPQTSTGSIGSLLQGLGAQYPNLSFTLPDGTTFTGNNGLFTNPVLPVTHDPQQSPLPNPTPPNPLPLPNPPTVLPGDGGSPLLNPMPAIRAVVGRVAPPLVGGGSVNPLPYRNPGIGPPVVRNPVQPPVIPPRTPPTGSGNPQLVGLPGSR